MTTNERDDARPEDAAEPGESATPAVEPAEGSDQPGLGRLARAAGIYLVFALVVSLLSELLLEAARTGWDWGYLGELLTQEPGVLAIGSVVLTLVVSLILSIVGRMWFTAALMLGLASFLGVASQLKFVERREPIYPRDLVFLLEPKFLMDMVQPRVLWLTLLGLVPIVAFTWGLSRLFKLWLRRRSPREAARKWRAPLIASRVAVVAISAVLLSSLLHFNHSGNPWRKAFESAGAHWAKASQTNNYRVNGFLGGFLYNLDIPAMRKPPGYSRAAIERIVAKYSADAEELNKSRDTHALDDVNVVSVLSESFSDPTRLSGMQLPEDPIPHTHELMQKVPHGLMLALKTGGGTSSMEFETLTGMSLSQFNSAMDTPYQMLIPKYRTFPSAVELFKQLGHTPLAIHPYRATMYQRDHVYPILGFSDFIDGTRMEHKGRPENNPFISDLAAFRQVKHEIDGHSEPLFINLVTMQNHTPYTGKYYDPLKVEGLDPEGADMVGQYSRGLTLSDDAMARFVRSLERSDEKTIVVFYGDHVPAGLPTSLFAKNSDRTMHETPFFIYSNFGKPNPETLPTTSPIFFLPHVFDQANAPLPPYYMLLKELESHVSALEHGRLISSGNYEVTPDSLSPEGRRVLRDYRLVQYDLSVGHRWAEKMFYETPAGTVAASGVPESGAPE